MAQSGIADAVGLDWGVDLAFARARIQPRRVTQGNLDPLALMAGGEALDSGVDAIIGALGAGRISSISGTVFCLRRRSPMWSGW